MLFISKKKKGLIITGLLLLMLPLSWYCGQQESIAPSEAEIAPQIEKPAVIFGKIYGTVTDARTGEPLAGTNISLAGTKTGAATDQNGKYFILNVMPGIYQLQASRMGYQMILMKDVRIKVRESTQVDFKLKEGVINLSKKNEDELPPPPPPIPKETDNDEAVFVAYEKAPEMIGALDVQYPEELINSEIEATVYLIAVIDEDGKIVVVETPKNSDVIKSKTEQTITPEQRFKFVKAAMAALKSSQWKPATQRGQAVKVRVGVPVEFTLDTNK